MRKLPNAWLRQWSGLGIIYNPFLFMFGTLEKNPTMGQYLFVRICFAKIYSGVAQWQRGSLLTKRLQVRILPPEPFGKLRASPKKPCSRMPKLYGTHIYFFATRKLFTQGYRIIQMKECASIKARSHFSQKSFIVSIQFTAKDILPPIKP